ncbi:MAG: DUF1830 domain-containing protein [Sphaerospermopsis sp.]|uniref:DUF1830 domain-containing protein n=3 Tax=Sphaerospermopsis TaxID=752201 RepID=A0A480A544_9CYAN|nr:MULTISPECIES: DUF1830 domain-containing protein [Sphaerospermopsis]MEB3149518.1 DUF1830 domain-containing protein [Sphaerospermopsis sp.]BAZ81643.1 hypothetical protein NIES73_29110 [Sphaerospermopsis kisseleviana NIES-73]MBD2134321.1 DUF1830 domain-containing protein [Sphaerospermopsis sp. FACHB-1094]MBD2147968.1 DUF1830 domain-containing protein [Sphaerospermopsis sp. FACHB-1194]MBE9235016.1 DUF1830 domain-containing protein [Sphaerospermopsis aphanizomenoides LEGE 00250]
MAQILDSLPPEQSGKILCCYVNATSKIQVARISNVANWYFERVVFPGQRLVFEAPKKAQMEIHTGMMASAILSDTIPCDRLALNEPGSDEGDQDSAPGIEAANTNAMVSEMNTKIEDTTKPLQNITASMKTYQSQHEFLLNLGV